MYQRLKMPVRLGQRELRRMQERMMSSLGVSMKELGTAKEVMITLEDKKIRINNPSIVALDTAAGKIYQIIGGEEIEEQAIETKQAAYEPSPEDIALVAMQAGVTEEQARAALIEAEGDLAKAILALKTTQK